MKSFLFFLCLLPLFSFAQTSSISGRVIGEDKGPLEFINVVLQNTSDSSIVKAVASDATGSFNIENLREGSYFLQFSYVGFEALFTEPFQLLESEEKTLGNQTLVVKSESLNEIEVAFTKPLVEVKADRTIFNVEGTANAIGLNALELLRKAPGVMVDNNDKIMVKGKAGITVYIDGKLTPMDSDGLAAMLKNMQSSNIESIEIITNPSAKYDAAGNAGIINIKLKKNKNFGTNGSVSAGYAIQKYAKYNTSINLNHRNAKWNLFGLYGNNWGNYWNYMNLDRRQNETSYSQRTNMRSGGLKQNFKLGADYFINSKNTIGVMVSGNMGQNNNLNTSKTFIGNTAQTQIDSVLIAESNTNGERNNIGFNLNYRFADTLGHELNVDADYGIYDIFSNTYQPNSYFNPSENILTSERNYQNNTTTDISISSLKADYEQNLLKGKLSGGFKFSQVETLNKLDFFNFVDNAMVLDSNKTNKFNLISRHCTSKM